MIRLLWFLFKFSLVLGLIALVSQHQTTVTISAGDYVLSMSSLTLAMVAVVVFVMFAYVTRSYVWLINLPARLRRAREEKRRHQGYRALTRGMVAVAAGEKLAARKSARRAEALLQDPPLTMLLSAQSAQLEGDELAAKRYFQQMLDEPETAFLGMRGLIMQALKQNNLQQAQQLLQQAEARFPRQPWICAQNLELQERLGNSRQAVALVEQAKKLGSLSAEKADEKFIALKLDMAELALDEGRITEARTASEEAWKRMQRSSQPLQHHDFVRLRCLMFTIALSQRRFAEADRLWPQLLGTTGEKTAFKLLNQRLDGEGLEKLERWKKQKTLLRDSADKSAVAHYLCYAALEVGLIGEAEKALSQDVSGNIDAPTRSRAEAELAIATARKDGKAIALWQQKVLEAK